jgi:formylglycine-generating enzyme required for sulfatase activity
MAFDVFISYPHQDKATADAACAKLEAEGIRCWIAPRDVEPGAEWAGAIVDAIDHCRAMVLIFSSSANESKRIRREVQQAFDGEKPVVPFRIENVVPEKSLRYYMGPVHWLDALTLPLEQHLQKLATSVGALVGAETPGEVEKEQALRAAEARRQAEEGQRWEEEERRRKAAAEAERQRLEREAGATRDAEERARQAAAAEAERQRQERDAAAAREAEEKARQVEQRLRDQAEAKRRAEEEERHRVQPVESRPGSQSTRKAVIATLIGAAVIAAIVWFVHVSPTPVPILATPGDLSVLSAEQERAQKPKDTFKECTNCPEMIVVSAGSFTMGSPASEPGRGADEGPQHKATFARQFAVGRFELTFDEWDACVANGGCNGYKPSDQGWGRGRRPMINVSWDDAKAYVAWLSRETGKPYRLLSEAEFEYAARAGSQTAYPWGNDIGKGNANCLGCGSQWGGKQTAPVGSFAANAFGLYDMAGNAWEWVEDCYHDNYNGAPIDSSAWTSGDCSSRVLRGGAWNDYPQDLRSAGRIRGPTDGRGNRVGFRVGRTLITP